jgi:PAP2 superfamily
MGVDAETVPEPSSATSTTRRSRRITAVSTYAVALALWTWLAGMPNDTIQIFLWLWLGSVAWNIEAPPREHLRFLRDWWPPLLGLVVYFYTRGIADNLGIPVSVRWPIEADRWLFGGHLPTEVLQHRLCGDPCDPDSPPRWYDLFFTTVYASHFVTGLTIAAVLWIRNRAEFVRWMRQLVSISFAALVVYVAYPMAPPWWAAKDGYLPSDLHRITGRGWEAIGIDRLNLLLGGVGNKVAAMPSLHTGIALLVAVYAVQRLQSPLRWLLLLYPVAMGTALVYYAEHYVIDVLAAVPLVAVVMVACSAWERKRADRAVGST